MASEPRLDAQTLAHPGWVGNGVNIEPWWKRAVFYRIDPTKFQATGDASQGDLSGILKRMDYIQSLGVDAIVIDTAALPGPDGFDDIARAAVDAHLRALVELGAPASQSAEDDAKYLGLARAWLNQGAAGLYVPTAKLAKIDGAGHIANLLQSLRALTNSFPGERVLLADAAPASDTGGQDQDLVKALAKETQLTASKPFRSNKPDAASLRAQMLAALANAPATSNPLLVAERAQMLSDEKRQGDGPDEAALQRALAAVLLASRGAVMLDYGEELGLIPASSNASPLMQWTPSNVTPKPAPPLEPAAIAPGQPAESAPKYSSFTAFIPPLPRNFFPPPKMPDVVVSDNPVPRNVDPNSLPGFTSGELDSTLLAFNGGTANVAMESADTDSLLNLYRHLIQLHHGNATLRNGAESVLDHDDAGALVWVRHASAGSLNTAEVVVVCNLSAKPFTLDLAPLHLRSGTLRTLLGASATHGVEVAPGAVFVGEVR
jgi:glycosidase